MNMTIREKRGELSIRDTFIECLREIMHNENYTVFSELILKDTLQKIIKIPDVVILENGKFKQIEEDREIYIQMELNAIKTVIETKHSSKYASEGLRQLFKYCDILNVNFSNFFIEYKFLLST